MPDILTHFEDKIFTIQLHRPKKRNAITFSMLSGLAQALDEAAGYQALRGILLVGEGEVFSAGLDRVSAQNLFQQSQTLPNFLRHLRLELQKLQSALNAFEEIEVPILAAIQGAAMGLGLELALACDLRMASPEALLSLPEVKLGLIPDLGGTTRLTRIVGEARAKELLFTGRNCTAEEALQWGLLNWVVPREKLLSEAKEKLLAIAECSPLAVGLVKRVATHGRDVDRIRSQELERLAQSLLLRTKDFSEGVIAFAEKRKPEFTGE